MTTYPVRIDRLQAGIIAWIEAALPDASVFWAPSEFPRDAAAPLVVTAKMLAPPSAAPLGGASASVWTLPTSATIRVLGATEGEGVGLRVSGRRWEHTIGAAETVTTVRDALLDEIGDEPMVSADFTASGTDRIVITGDAIGDLYHVGVMQSAAGLIERETQTTEVAQVELGEVRSYVEIEARSREREPWLGATAALSRLMNTTRLQTARAALDAFGVSFVGSPPAPTELDALSGPAWSSRAQVSIYFGQIALAAASVSLIERVRGSLSVPGTAAITIDTDPPT